MTVTLSTITESGILRCYLSSLIVAGYDYVVDDVKQRLGKGKRKGKEHDAVRHRPGRC
jgi:hypothetical protein